MENGLPYTIFVSHTGIDTPIARAITKVLTNAFRGEIALYLADSNVPGGILWKEELALKLRESDAIISIVTPDSINKPWIYVEWSAFWLANKTGYTLWMGDLHLTDFIQPMLDRQITCITDRIQVTRFFEGLLLDSKADIPTPYQFVDEFTGAVSRAQNEKLDLTYNCFRVSLHTLPHNDLEKLKIANFFYGNAELAVFERIASQIRDDTIKTDLVISLLKDSKFSHAEELEVTRHITANINSAERLGYISIQLIKIGDLDSVTLREIIESMSHRNQAELRKVAIYLINHNQEDTELFDWICSLMTNMAEFRKIAEHFAINNRGESTFLSNMLETFTNNVELRKLGEVLVNNGDQRSSSFRKIVDILKIRNQVQLNRLLEKVLNLDVALYEQLTISE